MAPFTGALEFASLKAEQFYLLPGEGLLVGALLLHQLEFA